MIPKEQLDQILSSLKKRDDRFFYSTDTTSNSYYSPFNVINLGNEDIYEPCPGVKPHHLISTISEEVINGDTKFALLKDIKIVSNLIDRLHRKHSAIRLNITHYLNKISKNKEKIQEDENNEKSQEEESQNEKIISREKETIAEKNLQKLVDIIVRGVSEFVDAQNKIKIKYFENAFYRLCQYCSQNTSTVLNPSINWIELTKVDPDEFYPNTKSYWLRPITQKENSTPKAYIPKQFINKFKSKNHSNLTLSDFLHHSFRYLFKKENRSQFNDPDFSDKYGWVIREIGLLFADEEFVNGRIINTKNTEKEKEEKEEEKEEPELEIIPETRKRTRGLNNDGVQPAKKLKADDPSPTQVSPPSILNARYGPEKELMGSIKEIIDNIGVPCVLYEVSTNPNLRYPICSKGIEKLKQISRELEIFLKEVPDELK